MDRKRCKIQQPKNPQKNKKNPLPHTPKGDTVKCGQ